MFLQPQGVSGTAALPLMTSAPPDCGTGAHRRLQGAPPCNPVASSSGSGSDRRVWIEGEEEHTYLMLVGGPWSLCHLQEKWARPWGE